MMQADSKIAAVLIVTTIALTAGRAGAQQINHPGFVVESVVSGLSNPTSMVFVGLNRILVNEQSTGRVRVVINGVLLPTPALDLPVATGLEPGLHGMIKHPNFSQNGYVYVYYTRADFDGGPRIANRISRFTWNGSTLDASSEFVVHELPAQNSGHHGGIIAFGNDGTIYAGIGDQHANEQTSNFQTGGPREVAVVVRFNQDGTVPADNPFSTPGWEYIYAYGIRNHYGMSADPLTGRLWQSENGPPLIEEINLLTPGSNSGWEHVFGFADPTNLFEVAGSHYQQPKFVFRVTAAPTAVTFQPSPVFGAEFRDTMFVGEGHFSSPHRIFNFQLNAARDGLSFDVPALQDLEGNGYAEMAPIIFGQGWGIVSDIEIGPDGFMYVVDISVGAITRVRPDHPTGDGDSDGDIDFADFRLLQICLSATGGASSECRASFDLTEDGNVDRADFAVFVDVSSGPVIMP